MKSKQASKIINDHFNGKHTEASKKILSEIATQAKEAGLKPPFKVAAIRVDTSSYEDIEEEDNYFDRIEDEWNKIEEDKNYKEWILNTYKSNPENLNPEQRAQAEEMLENEIRLEKENEESMRKHKEKIEPFKSQVPPGKAISLPDLADRSLINPDKPHVVDYNKILREFINLQYNGDEKAKWEDPDGQEKEQAFLSNVLEAWNAEYGGYDRDELRERGYGDDYQKAKEQGKDFFIVEDLS